MSNPQRFREIEEVISKGDLCRTTDGNLIPAESCIGRIMRKENVGWVLTHAPHTKESEAAMSMRTRDNGEVYG